MVSSVSGLGNSLIGYVAPGLSAVTNLKDDPKAALTQGGQLLQSEGANVLQQKRAENGAKSKAAPGVLLRAMQLVSPQAATTLELAGMNPVNWALVAGLGQKGFETYEMAKGTDAKPSLLKKGGAFGVALASKFGSPKIGEVVSTARSAALLSDKYAGTNFNAKA